MPSTISNTWILADTSHLLSTDDDGWAYSPEYPTEVAICCQEMGLD